MPHNNPVQQRLRAESFRHFARHTFGKKHFGWWTVLYAGLFMLVASWLPDGIADFCRYLIGNLALWSINWKLLVSIGLLLFFGFQLSKITQPPNIVVKSDEPELVKVMALFLSPISLVYGYDKPPATIRKGQEEEWLEGLLVQQDVTSEAMNGTTWQMPLKAIDFHARTLECLYLITSSGSRGTASVTQLFERFLHRLYPHLTVIEFTKDGVDFEDISKVFEVVEAMYANAVTSGYKENDVLIDITGGKKTNSIAASIAALARGRKFQYISHDKLVRSFDIEYYLDEER